MIDFNLAFKKPEPLELRAYLYQLLCTNFGMTENLRNYLRENFPDLPEDESKWDLNTLSDADIQNSVKSQGVTGILPEKLYYFKQNESATPYPSDDCDYKKVPELFTDIMGVSFDKGGLIVMEFFSSQIYTLFNSKGERLTDYCHDLDLGPDGLIIYRTSRSCLWSQELYDGNSLNQIDWYGPFDSPRDFPNISDRDMITEMFLPDSFKIPDIYNSGKMTDDQVIAELKKDGSNYRFLRRYFYDNRSLAVHAVNSNPIAFTLLSEGLRNDKEFVLVLLNRNERSKHLYPYLNRDLKKDIEIITLCIDEYPDSLRYISPVSDSNLMIRALKKDGNALQWAADELKSDKQLILEIVKEDWYFLRDASIELLTDYDFMTAAVKCYNDFQKDDKPLPDDEEDIFPWDIKEKKTLTLTEAVEYIMQKCGNTKVMKLIAPVSDMNLICKGLAYTEEEDMHSVLDCISKEIKESREFWLEAVRHSLYALKNAPQKYKHDREIVLAAIRYNGELIKYSGEELMTDPEVFLTAIEQITQRRGVCSPDEIIPLMNEELKSNHDFLLRAFEFYPHIIKYASEEVRSDREFMLKTINKYKWSVEYASDKLRKDPLFLEMLRKAGIDPEIVENDDFSDLPF